MLKQTFRIIVNIFFIIGLVHGSAFGQNLSAVPTSAWQQLFNGKNLNGWNFHFSGYDYNENPFNTLKVADGLLKVDYSGYKGWNGEFGHFARDEVYSHFLFAVEYRFVGEQTLGAPGWAFRNNGIMFHSESMSGMKKNQDFPVSVEAQLLQRGTEDQPTSVINLCNGASKTTAQEKPNCSKEEAAVVIAHKNAWVRAEVLVLGDSLAKFMLNGDTLGVFTNFKYAETGKPIKEGRIALQAESHNTQFRKIEIVNLAGCMDPANSNYKPYFFKNDPDSCK
ncbi:MAG: DUF1080 domain-containing protein [bacterium]|nr:DUF1080 domain-containing protein [bacterium]